MADLPHAEQGGQDQGLGFEPGLSAATIAEKTFFRLAISVFRAIDFNASAGPGGLRFDSEVKLPGNPPRLHGGSLQYSDPTFYVGDQRVSQEVAREAHKQGLSDFLTSEMMIAEGKPLADEARVLGTWVLMGHKRLRATDIPQQTGLDVHVFWHRSKRTAERYAHATLTRVLPTGQVAVQQVAVRIRREYKRGYEDGPTNTAELGRFTEGGFRAGSGFTSLEIYDDVFRPRISLRRLDMAGWQDAIEQPLVENDILRLRKDK